MKKFKDRESLKNLVINQSESEFNFIDLLIIHNTSEVIIFTLEFLKENLSDFQYQEILRTKSKISRNLLHLAAWESQCIKTHRYLWCIFRDFCGSNENFFNFLKKVDEKGSHVFALAACFCSNDVIKYMIEELENIAAPLELKEFFNVGSDEVNSILQFAIVRNTSIDVHNTLWTLVEKYYNSDEILKIIQSTDLFGDTFMIDAVYWKTKKNIEFTWNKIKEYITRREDQAEYLKRNGYGGTGLKDRSMRSRTKDPEIVPYIESLMKSYDIHYYN